LADIFAREQVVKRLFIFPPHLINAFASPGKHEQMKVSVFAEMLYYCFAKGQAVAG